MKMILKLLTEVNRNLNDAKDITKEMVLLRYSSTKEQPQIVGGAIKNIQIINRRPIDIV